MTITPAIAAPDALAPAAVPPEPGVRLGRLALLYARWMLPLLTAAMLAMSWPAADGVHDRAGTTFGHDLSQVWVAGREVLAGRAAEAYDDALHERAQLAVFGAGAARFGWHYPPPFLLVAAALASLPYPLAVLLWATGSVLMMSAALLAVTGSRQGVLLGLAAPPVALCLSYGQNGLLSAALLALGLVLAERRPWAGGLVLGLLCYKPQLAIVAPLVMLLSGRWRAVSGFLVSASALAALSLAAFGPEPWRAFIAGAGATNSDIFAQGWAGFALNASVFGAARLLGAGTAGAWVAQGVVALGALAFAARSGRRPDLAPAQRHAILIAAVPLVSPYMPVYDLAILVPALACCLMGRGELRAWEQAVLLALFAISLDPRGLATATHVPFGLVLSAGVFGLASAGAFPRGSKPARP